MESIRGNASIGTGDEDLDDGAQLIGWPGAIPAIIALVASIAQVFFAVIRRSTFGAEATLAVVAAIASAVLVFDALRDKRRRPRMPVRSDTDRAGASRVEAGLPIDDDGPQA